MDSVTKNTITLYWTNVADSSFYQIFYMPAGSAEAEQRMISTSPVTTLTGLTPSTMYDLRVESVSPNGKQPVGNTTATTGKCTVGATNTGSL